MLEGFYTFVVHPRWFTAVLQPFSWFCQLWCFHDKKLGNSPGKAANLEILPSLVTQTTNPTVNPAVLVYIDSLLWKAVWIKQHFTFFWGHVCMPHVNLPHFMPHASTLSLFQRWVPCFSAHLSQCFAHGSRAKWCDLKFPSLMTINSITMDQLRCQKIKWLWLNFFWLWAVAEMSHFHSLGELRKDFANDFVECLCVEKTSKWGWLF